MTKLWVRMPVDYIGQLSANGLILLSLLMNMDIYGGEFNVRLPMLAEQMHCSHRQICNLLKELEQAGLILSRRKLPAGVMLRLKPDILPPRRKSKGMRLSEAPKNAEAASFELDDFDLLVNRF